ncbi:MAG: T9SS type A sorting domain-containing protein [Bacteroidetes bacterium]|nr:MAG: T9SS type A sorting domain-containing protein [Bacteroidota bacterium]
MHIRIIVSIILFSLLNTPVFAQFLPHALTEAERQLTYVPPAATGYTTPPVSAVRTPAEWEEIDGLCVRWEGSFARSTLREIVRHAKEECTVYIVTENQNSVTNYLSQFGINTNNIVFVDEPSNSIWFRDYGQWNIYTDDVDSLLWVDWIYNRPRPADDVVPEALAQLLDIPLYQTTEVPYDLVNTGGNFMVDGFGTAFASELIIEENDGTGYGISNHSESAIDGILEDFMGIDRYIKMPTLPYDGIHHIDMHMKLLDEETLLVGEYPTGVADGPQIESNLSYVLNNFNSVYGTDYKVIRIPMPPEGGQYPDTWGDYRTYTNSVFVNNTILVPIYEEQWDTTALRIYREALPGYKVVGIDCNEIITASGAIHCITKAVASIDPLLIRHQPLEDQAFSMNNYQIDALIKHADGIANASVYWTTDTTAGYTPVAMNLTNATEDTWTGYIPYQQAGEKVFYYIHAEANNGKQQNRPMPAPQGYWEFKILSDPTGLAEHAQNELAVYPNPTTDVLFISNKNKGSATMWLKDSFGRIILLGNMSAGKGQFDLSGISAGVYNVVVQSNENLSSIPVLKLD